MALGIGRLVGTPRVREVQNKNWNVLEEGLGDWDPEQEHSRPQHFVADSVCTVPLLKLSRSGPCTLPVQDTCLGTTWKQLRVGESELNKYIPGGCLPLSGSDHAEKL